MKKVGILFVLLSALSFSAASQKSTKAARPVTTQSVISRFNQLEAEYARLSSMEDQEYNKLKASAENAKARLAEKEEQRAQLDEKIAKIEEASGSKAFKAQYAELAKQYKAVAKALDSEINSLKTTVENFDAIESLKGNQ